LLGQVPFERFLALTDWLYAETHQTHQIALERLFDLLYTALQSQLEISAEDALACLAHDYAISGARGAPKFLEAVVSGFAAAMPSKKAKPHATRQARHGTA
jgi:hypothetical protein